MAKKLKTSRIKAKIIYFEASNYGKKVKNIEFSQKFFFWIWITHFNPIKLYVFWKYNWKTIWIQQDSSD